MSGTTFLGTLTSMVGWLAVFDVEGVAPKIFEEYKNNLEKERQNQIEKINSKYEKALKLLEE